MMANNCEMRKKACSYANKMQSLQLLSHCYNGRGKISIAGQTYPQKNFFTFLFLDITGSSDTPVAGGISNYFLADFPTIP